MAESTTQEFGGRVATVGYLVDVKMSDTWYNGQIVGIEPDRDVPKIEWGPDDRSWGWDRGWDEFAFWDPAINGPRENMGDLYWTWKS